ncbi:MAG: hypothetical protein AMJ78_08150 [Omnitrophica WOR_2 bacterium SM23_29]|nr:MAG: hypothetical protein AMJ78_08150 [Omnitrophica WOR_2 bacterium SM23_29]
MSRYASRLDYAFAIGKIRALERFLIKDEVFKEAVDSDLQEALRLFVESNLYSEDLLHIKDSQQTEVLLSQELLKAKKLINILLLDKELIGLTEIENFTGTKKLISKYKSEFLNDYLMHLIDMHNIKTFLRLYVLKEPLDVLKGSLSEEGFIKVEVFIKAYNQDLSVLVHKLGYVHKRSSIVSYASFLQDAISKLGQDNSFATFEKAIVDFLIQILRPAKYISFGPEPLLAYYFAKTNEIDLMRMIILAKLNNVSNDIVRERLNTVYA